jgi:hypothetical protein
VKEADANNVKQQAQRAERTDKEVEGIKKRAKADADAMAVKVGSCWG